MSLKNRTIPFETVLDVSPNPVVIYDMNGFPEYLNPAFTDLFGWTIDDLQGRHIPFVPDDQREITREYVQKVASQHVTINFETSRLTKGGERLDFIVGATELRDAGGEALGQIVTFTDITALKYVERQLRARESWLQAIFQASPVPIVVYDAQGHPQHVNPAFVALFGWTLDELQGKTIPFVPDDQKRISAAVIADLYARRLPVTLETKRLTKDGALVDILIRGALITGLDGAAEGMVVALTDTTAFKHVEAELKESRARLQAIFEASPTPIIVYDTQGYVLFLNASFEELFGWTFEELKGRRIPFVPDDQRGISEGVIRNLYASGRPARLETRRMKKNGEIIDIIISAALVHGEKGNAEGMVVAIADLSDRKKAEKDRLEMERRLLHSQKLESLGILAGGIAHDFNNLLTAILGNIEIAKMIMPPQTKAYHNVEAAERASLRAAGLTRQMLDYSGRGTLVKESADINELVAEMTHLLKSSISKNVTLTMRLAPDIPAIAADTSQIQQVVMNLIVNASEAIEMPEGVISIITGCRECDHAYLAQSHIEKKPQPGLYVFIEITDTGCGMDESTQRKLFDPFFTTKFTGRGLGLSAVLGIVKGHDGAIMLNSAPRAGTTFTVLFPAQDASSGDRRKTPGTIPVSIEPSLSGTTLIVDDEEIVRDVLSSQLESLGVTPLAAPDGEHALSIFRSRKDSISLVIVDFTMPGMDGVTLFDELRELNPDIKVVLMTGFNSREIRNRLTGKGFCGFIQKPFDLDSLKHILTPLLSSDS